MKLTLRWFVYFVLFSASGAFGPASLALFAEKVADLPAPTGYVSDFAQVLSPETRSRVEDLCTELDRQAHAQLAIVTIKTLDDDQSIEEFTTDLENKWKVGAKGTDRGVLMVLVMTPRRGRIEVGYGLEGILNDAKVGDIGRSMVPDAERGDYNEAIPLGADEIAKVISTDAGVTLTPITHQYRRVPAGQGQAAPLTLGRLLVYGAVALFVLFLLSRGGGGGLVWFLLGNLMGGGFGGGRGGGGFGDGGRDRDDNGGGGFGGFGGGSSGGGGASGDF